jgi:hypothetical protein
MGYYFYTRPNNQKLSLSFKVPLTTTIYKNLFLYIVTMIVLLLTCKYIWWSGKEANASDTNSVLSTILMLLSVPLGIYFSKRINGVRLN